MSLNDEIYAQAAQIGRPSCELNFSGNKFCTKLLFRIELYSTGQVWSTKILCLYRMRGEREMESIYVQYIYEIQMYGILRQYSMFFRAVFPHAHRRWVVGDEVKLTSPNVSNSCLTIYSQKWKTAWWYIFYWRAKSDRNIYHISWSKYEWDDVSLLIRNMCDFRLYVDIYKNEPAKKKEEEIIRPFETTQRINVYKMKRMDFGTHYYKGRSIYSLLLYQSP